VVTDGEARGFLALPARPAPPDARANKAVLLVATVKGKRPSTGGGNAESVKLNSVLV